MATIEQIAQGYDVSRDYDYYNTKLASRLILPYCQHKDVIEVGCATGQMTEELVLMARSLTVIEPSSRYAVMMRERFQEKLRVINAFTDDVKEELRAEVVILASLLHHLERPAQLLDSCRRFLRPGGVLLATVPNMRSLHRRVGVKSGMIDSVYATTSRNVFFDQPGRFDKERLRELFEQNGFEVGELFGYMLKPFSSEQMMRLELGWDVIDALFELGREFEALSSQLFISARLKERSKP